jgi:hypothetical protein
MLFAAAVVLSGALSINAAWAQAPAANQTQACYAQARQQVLQGEALVNFMSNCTSGEIAPTRVSADPAQQCADRARLLSGEAKVEAMRACSAQ